MTLTVRNPYDGEIVREIAHDTPESLDDKVEAAQRAFETWRRMPLERRAGEVSRGLEYFEREKESIAREVTLQMGKPLRQALAEVDTLLLRARHMLSIAAQALAPDAVPAPEPFHLRIEHVPHGVVFNIGAWNYPLIIPINVVVPALLAGNTVILKHSARTPLCGVRFAEAFGRLEPPDLLAHVVLDHEQTAALIADRRIGHVAFTGSVEGGREIHRAASSRFIDCGLELGGKDPAYVAADADLEFTAANVVDGACYNAGQSCCAVERVYVHSAVRDQFLALARKELESYRLGDPLDDTTTMGPLASSSAPAFLEHQVGDAVRRGASLLLGGARPAGLPGNFFSPTLIDGVPNDADVMQEESFGPLVPVLAVSDDDEAIVRINESRFGLTASVWTRDRERAERFAREVQAGTIFQNRADYLDPALPWTGFGDSGKGSTLSRYGFWHLTRRKAIHFRAL